MKVSHSALKTVPEFLISKSSPVLIFTGRASAPVAMPVPSYAVRDAAPVVRFVTVTTPTFEPDGAYPPDRVRVTVRGESRGDHREGSAFSIRVVRLLGLRGAQRARLPVVPRDLHRGVPVLGPGSGPVAREGPCRAVIERPDDDAARIQSVS